MQTRIPVMSIAVLLSLLLTPMRASSASQMNHEAPSQKSTTSQDEVKIPATPAGQLFGQWLETFNSGDAGKIRNFTLDHFATEQIQDPDRRVQMDVRLRAATGGFELKQIENSTDAAIAGFLKERNSGNWAHFQLRLSADDPQRIAGLELRPAPAPMTQTLTSPSNVKEPIEQLTHEVDTKLSDLAARDEFSGAVLIARNDKILWQKGYGYADREAKIPAGVNTRFRIGSMNKMITSVAIGQLVQQGKLKYTDTIADVLPDYPNAEVARKITVAELLTHTSGLEDFFGPEFLRTKGSLHSLRDYLALFSGKPLAFEPGTSWEYSNAGFIVLGLMIEKLSGEDYYGYVQHHVYAPAGMKDSGSTPIDAPQESVAIGYTRRASKDSWEANTDTLPWRGNSAGGGESTVGDLFRFAEALRSHKLLNTELTTEVLTGKVHPPRFPEGRKYAYGFDERLVDGERVVGHNGGAPGMNGQLDMHMIRGYTVVVLANRDPRTAEEWTNYISNRLP